MRTTIFFPPVLVVLRLLYAAIAGLLVAGAPSSARLDAQGTPPPSFEATGLQPQRSYFSELPFESVDMINGNVILTFTDLALPGDAGMDLQLTRTYNHQDSLRKWHFGFAGVPLRIENPAGNGNECCDLPLLVMADGSKHQAHQVNQVFNETEFITDRFWRYTTSDRTLRMPNGWTATYETGNPIGGAMLVEVHDVYGNSLTPDWEGGATGDIRPLRLESVTQTVGGTTRLVAFEYDPITAACGWMPKKMTFAGREWHYGCEFADPSTLSGPRLTSATPPVGLGWTYAYANGLDGSVTVTTPNGGTVLYDFDDLILPSYESGHKSVIAARVIGGRDIPGDLGARTSTFEFVQPAGEATGTVNLPGGRQLVYGHGWAPLAGKWILDEKILKAGDTQVARVDREHTDLAVVSAFPTWTVPVVEQDTITQDGRVYTTGYEYRATNFGDYHQPWRITETGHLTRVTTREYDYDVPSALLNRLKSETVTIAGESFTTSYSYEDATGFLDRQTTFGITTTFGRDTRGNRNRITDANNHSTTFTHEWGVVKNTVTPEFTIARTINSDGTVGTEVRRGLTTTFVYTAGRLGRVEPPLGDWTYTDYDDAAGAWVKVRRGSSFTTTPLDGFGRPRGTENAVGVKTEIRYDRDGRKAYESRPYESAADNVGDTFEYDAVGRLKRVTHADASTVTYAYTHDSVTITDEEGHATVQTWQAFGTPEASRLTAVTDADNKTWSYSYNAVGSLEQVTQPGGKLRTWDYDTQNRLASETHPESGTTTYDEYWPAGQLKKKTDARGQVFTYGYDGNDRLTTIDAPGTDHDVVITYDASDNRTRIRNGLVDTRLDPDNANRLALREDTVNTRTFRTEYGYDGRDNLTQVTYPSGRVVGYDVNAANQITKVSEPNDGRIWADAFSYHPSGALSGYAARNGQGTAVAYDDPHQRYWPKTVQSGPVSLIYTYDNVGNVAAIADSRGGTFSQGFGYDAVDRLTSVTGLGAGTFTYDAKGNRLTKNGVEQTYWAGSERLQSDGVTSYGYDAGGNTTNAGSTTFTYTPFNMQETATVGTAVTTYRYDADNQRRMRTGPTATEYFVSGPGLVPLAEYRAVGGVLSLAREYLYAGSRLLASEAPVTTVAWTDDPLVRQQTVVKRIHLTELRDAVNMVREKHGLPRVNWIVDPTITQFGTAIHHQHIRELRAALDAVETYTYPTDPDLLAGATIKLEHVKEIRDRVVALMGRTGGAHYYHLDALGTVRAVTNAMGAVVRRHDYAPFGEEVAPIAGSDRRRFTGKERDAETGLDYFSARYHHPSAGRFTSADPGHVGGDLFDPQSWNAYVHARNNPLRFVDPSGTEYLIWAQGGGFSTTSDDAFGRIWNDPGAGYQLTGSKEHGAMWAWIGGRWEFAGWYEQTSVDGPRTFNGMISQSGALAGDGLKLGTTAVALSAVGGAAGGLIRGGIASGVVGFGPSVLASGLSKAGAVATIQAMNMPAVQATSVLAAARRATTSSTVNVLRQGSNIIVQVRRAGANGHQVIESIIGPSGAKTVVQRAYDAAGKLVHYDPK